jgi:hypothetical protein
VKPPVKGAEVEAAAAAAAAAVEEEVDGAGK